MTVEILGIPTNIPGYKMLETFRDTVRVAVSTEISLSTTASTDQTIFKVPANTVVLGLIPEIVTVVDGGSSAVLLTVGDTTAVDCLAYLEVSSLLGPTAAALATVGTYSTIAKRYTTAHEIHAFLTPGEGASGAIKLWLVFKTDSDRLNVLET